MISLFSILVPNYVMDRKRDSASLLFSRVGSQTSNDFQNSDEVMVCRKKLSIYFVEDKSIHKHNSLLEKNYCISLSLHGFCLQISVGLM